MTSMNSPAFRTANLNVFKLAIKPSDVHMARDYYFAFPRGDDHPVPHVIICVGPSLYGSGPTLDDVVCNRQYGTVAEAVEVCQAIEKHVGLALNLESAKYPEEIEVCRQLSDMRS